MSSEKSSKLVAENTLTPSQVRAIYEQIRSIGEQLANVENMLKPKPRPPRIPYDPENGIGTPPPKVIT